MAAVDLAAITESPVERMIAEAFSSMGAYWGKRPDVAGWSALVDTQESDSWLLSPQMWIAGYRVDFLMTRVSTGDVSPLFSSVIEVDGHEWHEKTPEQAARDRRRDRAILSWGEGLRIFRFTGSEVYRDAHACVLEVMNAIRRSTR
jgi:very-short-patch-repair endonuclease